MADDTLTRELVRNTLGKMGLVPPPNLGKLGITTKEFLLKDSLKIEYLNDTNEQQTSSFPLWCGEIYMGTSKMVALATDLFTQDEGYHEFCATFCVDNLAIHGVKHIFAEQEDAYFLKANENEWTQMSLYNKLLITAGMERLSDYGVSWRPCKDYERLYPKLVDLVEM